MISQHDLLISEFNLKLKSTPNEMLRCPDKYIFEDQSNLLTCSTFDRMSCIFTV